MNQMTTMQTQTNAVRIESLSQLQARCEQPMAVRFVLDGQVIEVPVRRLTPAEQEKVDQVYDFAENRSRELRPPLLKGRTPEEDRYDYNNEKYQAELEKLKRTARALAIYTGCPAVQAGKPGLDNRDEIRDYVQGMLTEHILNLLHLNIMAGGLDVAERVNFTSPPGSGD
jgi:hypothetical protein